MSNEEKDWEAAYYELAGMYKALTDLYVQALEHIKAAMTEGVDNA